MQVGKKWYGKSFSARRACASRKTSMSSNRSARVAGDCGALEQRSLRLGCDVFRRYQKSRQPVGSLTLASATQSLSSLSNARGLKRHAAPRHRAPHLRCRKFLASSFSHSGNPCNRSIFFGLPYDLNSVWLFCSRLPVVSFGYSTKRKVFIQIGPMNAKRRKLNVIQLLRCAFRQTRIRRHGKAKLSSALHDDHDVAVAIRSATRGVDQCSHAIRSTFCQRRKLRLRVHSCQFVVRS